MKGEEKRREERNKQLTGEVKENETNKENNHFDDDYNFVGHVCIQLLLSLSCLYNIDDDV